MMLFLLFLAAVVQRHACYTKEELHELFGTPWAFSGVSTFAHLKHVKCLLEPEAVFDIGVVGIPFDTAVTYRSGARFGPRALREASSRQTSLRAFNFRAGVNPYQDCATIVDCDDIHVTPLDNKIALQQMTIGYKELLKHNSSIPGVVPKVVVLGGDHSVALAALRALHSVYGPITVIHFDAHLDTWIPSNYPSAWSADPFAGTNFTHGSMFWMAHQEGLLANNSCVHAGLRTRLSGTDFDDYEEDSKQGFMRIHSDEILDIGTKGIVDQIKERVPPDAAVYISVDIDVLDPGIAPGTGTPEAGGWLTRELIRIIRSLSFSNIVGADLVEVSPAYDHAEVTALAGAQIVYELLTSMVMAGRSNSFLRNGIQTQKLSPHAVQEEFVV